jgi:FixJ family two-component response regulator
MNKVQQFKLYVVDDDDGYRNSLVQLLESVGYSVESFLSGQSFLDAVPVADKTGVLILDLRMPGMTGFDLQKRMNELASRFNIIIITADAQPGDRDHAIEAGAIGFLQKPFQEAPLLELLGQAMGRA